MAPRPSRILVGGDPGVTTAGVFAGTREINAGAGDALAGVLDETGAIPTHPAPGGGGQPGARRVDRARDGVRRAGQIAVDYPGAPQGVPQLSLRDIGAFELVPEIV